MRSCASHVTEPDDPPADSRSWTVMRRNPRARSRPFRTRLQRLRRRRHGQDEPQVQADHTGRIHRPPLDDLEGGRVKHRRQPINIELSVSPHQVKQAALVSVRPFDVDGEELAPRLEYSSDLGDALPTALIGEVVEHEAAENCVERRVGKGQGLNGSCLEPHVDASPSCLAACPDHHLGGRIDAAHLTA